MRRKRGDVVKPRQNLPRICQGEPGPEARTKKILIDGALSQVRKLTPANHKAGMAMHLPVPTRTPATSQPRLGPLCVLHHCMRACPRGCSAHVRVFNKYSGEASAFLFSFPGPSPVEFFADRATASLACPFPPRRKRLGRDLGTQRLHLGSLTSCEDIPNRFPIKSSSVSNVMFARRAISSRGFLQSTPTLQCADSN